MADAPMGTLAPYADAEPTGTASTQDSSLHFSILTPTFNRAHTLPRLFASLEKQDFDSMEWIVVDDGSSDETETIVGGLARRSRFPVQYVYQKNNHKKSAVNRCVTIAKGELSIIVDSDDELEEQALTNFWRAWQSLPETSRNRLAGMRALCRDREGKIVGSKFPTGRMESTPAELQHKYRVRGEKISCERTEVLRRFPFKEDITGFVMEGTVWNEIGKFYKSLCLNFVARVYHFEPDSLSNMKVSSEMISKCEGLSYSYAKILDDSMCWFCYAPLDLTKMAVNWSRFTLHARSSGQKYFRPRTFFAFILGCVFFPMGWLRYQIDSQRINLRS